MSTVASPTTGAPSALPVRLAVTTLSLKSTGPAMLVTVRPTTLAWASLSRLRPWMPRGERVQRVSKVPPSSPSYQ